MCFRPTSQAKVVSLLNATSENKVITEQKGGIRDSNVFYSISISKRQNRTEYLIWMICFILKTNPGANMRLLALLNIQFI